MTPLRSWREKAGFTLNEISGLTGYSVPYLSRIERGQRGLPPHAKVVFCRRLGVTVAALFPPEPVRDIPAAAA